MLRDMLEIRGATALPEMANAARVMNSDRRARTLLLWLILTILREKVSSSIIVADNVGNITARSGSE